MRVLIIGGSSDIGISLAKYLKDKNNQVIITYNNQMIIDEMDLLHCNVTDENEIEEVISKLGNIDCLINMAAISRDNLLLDSNKKDFMDTLEVNLVGSYLTSRIYSKYNQNGMIINIASTDGIDTYNEYNMFYAVSKAGLIHLSKCLAVSTNNKVYGVCPNWINSNSTNNIDKAYLDNELKRIGQSRLIEIEEFNESIDKVINSNDDSGTIYRIDIKGDKLWIEKI